MATLRNGSEQAITTPPVIALDNATDKRFVFVGTGRLLDESDIISGQMQSFYAILDGSRAKFSTITNALTRKTDFVDNSQVKGLELASGKLGWYIDLGLGTNGNVYRIDAPIVASAGVVAFAKNLPDISDVCKPGGSGEGYVINYSTGKTALPNNAASISIQALVSSISMSNNSPYDQGVAVSFNTFATGTSSDNNNQIKTVSTNTGFKTLNWREVNAE
jgi:type IV pilus assembly protein PilY1